MNLKVELKQFVPEQVELLGWKVEHLIDTDYEAVTNYHDRYHYFGIRNRNTSKVQVLSKSYLVYHLGSARYSDLPPSNFEKRMEQNVADEFARRLNIGGAGV